jgi:serine/threonine protein phosphatase 1
MPTYAIGDIHGHVDPLIDLLDQLQREVTSDDTVVFLGDYIDRGADSRGCVEAMLAWRDAVPARCVFLLGAGALTTIASYSRDAETSLREAIEEAGEQLYLGKVELPYGAFFDTMPHGHRQFFTTLERWHDDEQAFLAHAGVSVQDPDDRGIESLVWGDYVFPDLYDGARTIVYGRKGDAEVDDRGWPSPHVTRNAIGIDSLKHGVLTAIRLPDRHVFQSRQYAPLR